MCIHTSGSEGHVVEDEAIGKASSNHCYVGRNDQQNRGDRASKEAVGSNPWTGNKWAGMTNEEPGPGGSRGEKRAQV